MIISIVLYGASIPDVSSGHRILRLLSGLVILPDLTPESSPNYNPTFD
jgi:hypothetical protein